MPRPRRVAVFSFKDDLHARLISRLINDLGHRCHHIATDRIANQAALSWQPDNSTIWDTEGHAVQPADLDVVWWRRVKGGQTFEHQPDPETRTLMEVECRTAFYGMMLTHFQGRWVNHPAADIRADNKLAQLQAAHATGWTIPQTLVSSVPDEIRAFVRRLNGVAIVKVVRGIPEIPVPTWQVSLEDLTDDSALQACPAIYQELIAGNQHLRIHVFGTDVFAVQIQAEHLDWRPHLNAPMEAYPLPEAWAARCRALTRRLGLEMGIIDAKLDQEGQLIFLEINPQGQFLFMEALAKTPIASRMASFLTAET